MKRNLDCEPVKCPFLDTIDRQMIDFDSEKLCSQTLTNMNVYVCLVCGKYFQGRGKLTPAYTHSVQASHFVFMNLHSGRTYCLPDDYEVKDSSLADIRRCLSPQFTIEEIGRLNNDSSLARDVYGGSYLPGFVGLNNLNCTDYLNAVLHVLAHVSPFRDFWLLQENYIHSKSNLVKQFGLNVRKIWSSHNFKSTVSPQELMQEISVESKKRFTIGQRAEALDLLIWLLTKLSQGIGETNKTHLSPLYEPFQGVIEVTSQTKRLVDSIEDVLDTTQIQGEEWVSSIKEVPFTFLSVDIPPCPLFRDSEGALIIPQIPLFELLKKFDGETWSDHVSKDAHARKKYRIKKLPRYLILHLVRFTRNNFYVEKNPTIVTFPVKNLEMKDYLFSRGELDQKEIENCIKTCPSFEELEDMNKEELQTLIQRLGSEQQKAILKINNNHENISRLRIVARTVVERIKLFSSTKYDLVANICHETYGSGSSQGVAVGDLNMSGINSSKGRVGKAKSTSNSNSNALDQGAFKVHLQNKATGQWFEMEDLRVTDTLPQLIGISESYLLVYEKK